MTQQPVGIFGEGDKTAVIAICNLTSIGNKPYATHLQFAYKLAKDNPEWKFLLFTPYRMAIADFRNHAVDAALDVGAEYVMFLDDDSILLNFAGAFKSLRTTIEESEKDIHIISPVYYVRGYPFHPMFFKESNDPDLLKVGKGLEFYDDFMEPDNIDEDGLLEVAALGCHCTLISTEVFPALERPYFLTGMNNTEDVYFCMKCRDYIENIGIYIDTNQTVGHLLDPLWVDKGNVDLLRKFYKDMGLTDTLDWAEAFSRKHEYLTKDEEDAETTES